MRTLPDAEFRKPQTLFRRHHEQGMHALIIGLFDALTNLVALNLPGVFNKVSDSFYAVLDAIRALLDANANKSWAPV